ncbi:flagellin N-terminal helical domain-containing protein [Iodobacter fluviatilis]|uniref:Flagellin n=1 Tax=Iodobacter fluviatilis TaxID=537 RepID=A0A377QAV0_9NEIS|nr:flagellin [Iodobacter fluviatilis]TCU89621.1 flagellin [Iodobacter fluviatilis]STQ90991.1 B-type flagellin [Iodobacter fluviatilis]
MQIINTNVAALMVQRNLEKTQTALNTSLQRLSSGLRINSAKDDPAGLLISERMSAKIRGLTQAKRNASDAISMAQTGEGALTQLIDILQRIRELAVQSANASNSASDRRAMNTEVTQLVDELGRIAQDTEFNSQKLFDGSSSLMSYQIGPNAGNTLSTRLTNLRTDQYGAYTIGSRTPAWSEASTGTLNYTDGMAGTISTVSGAVFSSGTLQLNGHSIRLNEADSARTIAAKINLANTGVIASARTETILSLGSGSYALTVASKSNNFSAVNFNVVDENNNGVIDRDEYASAISAFNAKSSKTGVLAQLIDFKNASGNAAWGIKLNNSDGNHIVLASNSGAASGFGGTVSVWNNDPATSLGNSPRMTESLLGSPPYNLSSSGSISFAGQVALNSNTAYSLQTDSTLSIRNGVFYNGGSSGTLPPANILSPRLSAVSSMDVSTVHNATMAMIIADKALDTLNQQRSSLGAFQNRIAFTIAYIDNSIETTSAARSRIRDADMAAEIAAFTRSQILMQVGNAMLAAANAVPNLILSLLKSL